MRRIHLSLIGVVFAANGLFAFACSGDSNPNDGGTGDAAPDGKPKPEAGGDTAVDAPPPVTPAGKELAASDGAQIFGITTDGFVIYADVSANGLFAADVAGANAPIKIAAPTGYAVGVAGTVVFVWSGLTTNQVGALSTWTTTGKTFKAIPNATKSAPNGGFAASKDGTRILYTANSDTAGANGDFFGANVDGTGIVSLVSAVDIGSTNNCRPVVGFASNTEAVTSTCTVTPPDGGTPSATVTSYAIAGTGDAGTWTPAAIISSALNFWSTDTAGDSIMVATTAGTFVYPIGGGAAVAIDTKNIENQTTGDWTFGYLAKGGAKVFYSTAAGDLWTASSTAPTNPAAVQNTGVKFVRALSANESYMMYTTTFDSQQFGGDLHLTATTAAAGATTLVSTTTGALFGTNALDDFTTDSQFAIWIENLDTQQGIGDLFAVPVTGGTPKQFASGEWQNASATGTKIVFNDNCAGCSGTGGTGNAFADLKVVDVATTNAPTLLQAGADVPLQAGGNSLWLSPAKDRLIYTYSQNTPSTGTVAAGGNGLYSITLP